MNNTPPRGLNKEARQLWRRIIDEYQIDDGAGLAILRTACETLTVMREAEKTVKTDGLTVRDKFKQVKGHPLLPMIRDSRAQYLAALKQLNLDLEPLRDRPGRPGGTQSKLTTVKR
jgi:P27 family predicted phage terminase small subunit